MLDVGEGWSDLELSILRDYWLLGHGDKEIAQILFEKTGKQRSYKGVMAKRRVIGLTVQHYPERPATAFQRTNGNSYTEEDNRNILERFNSGELIEAIARDYKVSRKTMDKKIERLLEKEATPKRVSTSRDCLWCRKSFMSVWPPAQHRKCLSCEEAQNEAGSSFLTVYELTVTF